MKLARKLRNRTLAREGVDDLFLDTFLTLRKALVLGEMDENIGQKYLGNGVPFLQPCLMSTDGLENERNGNGKFWSFGCV